MFEQPLSNKQFFQQVIETTITCRSIIKYNSTLNEAQKEEILTEIDRMITFLEARQLISSPQEAEAAFPAQQVPNSSPEAEETIGGLEDPLPQGLQQQQMLKNLYQLYNAHFRSEYAGEFETRYRAVMGVLDQLEEVAGQRHDTTSGDLTTEDMVRRIRSFISSMYYPLRELTVLLSHVLEGKNLEMDTEALARLHGDVLKESAQTNLSDITPLLHIYNTHRQFQEQNGSLNSLLGDATIFLLFLEESLEPTFSRRNEIVNQLKTTVNLLNDLTQLLTAYEQAMSTILAA